MTLPYDSKIVSRAARAIPVCVCYRLDQYASFLGAASANTGYAKCVISCMKLMESVCNLTVLYVTGEKKALSREVIIPTLLARPYVGFLLCLR